jgi:hypothetical protein
VQATNKLYKDFVFARLIWDFIDKNRLIHIENRFFLLKLCFHQLHSKKVKKKGHWQGKDYVFHE